MRTEIKYLEQKSGFSDNGPAWIGMVSFSKSGRTIYFDGKAFQSLDGMGIYGNYFDIETGDEYWISGVKKDMTDRHQFGYGKIFVEKRVLDDYLKLVGREELPKSDYELISVDTQKPIERINELENEKLQPAEFEPGLHFKKPNELNDKELEFVIAELFEEEGSIRFNKARRSCRKKRLELEEELRKRRTKNDGSIG